MEKNGIGSRTLLGKAGNPLATNRSRVFRYFLLL